MRKWLTLFILLGVITMIGCASSEEKASSYQNPVFEPVLADPSVIKAENSYFYAYGTEDDWGDGNGSRLTPIIRSKDLIEWEYVGEAFESKPNWKSAGGLWAPDVHYFNDKYYLYYSLSVWGDSNPGIGIATSDDPAGPFEDHGKLFDSRDIGVGNSIDPMLYVDGGTPYLFWGSFHGIYGIELSEDGMNTTGEKFQIAGSAFEATYIVERDGNYYFFGSKGSCCEGEHSSYHVAVGRSEELKGPYVDKDGKGLITGEGTLLLTGSFPDENSDKEFVGPGHNSIVTDDEGTDWIVYHAIDKDNPNLGSGATRRPLMIDPIVWEDGWPTIKGIVPSTGEQNGPVIK
jgi:arabinan endo-1,5-alpha-L-arabinosidase